MLRRRHKYVGNGVTIYCEHQFLAFLQKKVSAVYVLILFTLAKLLAYFF